MVLRTSVCSPCPHGFHAYVKGVVSASMTSRRIEHHGLPYATHPSAPPRNHPELIDPNYSFRKPCTRFSDDVNRLRENATRQFPADVEDYANLSYRASSTSSPQWDAYGYHSDSSLSVRNRLTYAGFAKCVDQITCHRRLTLAHTNTGRR